MALQLLRELESLNSVYILSTESLGFGVKKRRYGFLNSDFEMLVISSKWDDGVCYDTDDIKIYRPNSVNKKHSLHDLIMDENDLVQKEILMNINLFI